MGPGRKEDRTGTERVSLEAWNGSRPHKKSKAANLHTFFPHGHGLSVSGRAPQIDLAYSPGRAGELPCFS